MMNKHVFLLSVWLSLSCSGCQYLAPPLKTAAIKPLKPIQNIDATAQTIIAQAPDLNPKVAKLALTAFNQAHRQGMDKKGMLTIIDYSKPSTQRRFWVVDLRAQKVVYHELVAHGKNSGGNVATAFSDRADSLASSIGVYITANSPYVGKHGYSLRLAGLEKGYNEHAAARAIVVHGANYVSEQFAKQNGRLGLSWGCPALNPRVVKPVIDKIKGGTLVFAYYPDPKWLNESKFLRV